jgi:hypothetical protein
MARPGNVGEGSKYDRVAKIVTSSTAVAIPIVIERVMFFPAKPVKSRVITLAGYVPNVFLPNA